MTQFPPLWCPSEFRQCRSSEKTQDARQEVTSSGMRVRLTWIAVTLSSTCISLVVAVVNNSFSFTYSSISRLLVVIFHQLDLLSHTEHSLFTIFNIPIYFLG